MNIALIDYGSGNLRSAAKAFERAAADAGGGTVTVTSAARDLARATHVVLPGVGAFRDCRDGIAALPGMVEALERAVIEDRKPFLGICVGMQLLATVGREYGHTPGFGWIPGEVVHLTPTDPTLKIPHMGWNSLALDPAAHPALAAVAPGAYAYFVHSYGLAAGDPRHVLAEVDYGGPVTAVVGRDNILGTQFHPEKSQRVGLAVIAGFLKWQP